MEIDRIENDDSFFEINIAPMVDVVLVLLIIFMMTTPMLLVPQIKVDLPEARTGEPGEIDSFMVEINRNGELLLNGKPSDEPGIINFINENIGKNSDLKLVVSGDQEAVYKHIVRVIDLARSYKIKRFAISVKPETK